MRISKENSFTTVIHMPLKETIIHDSIVVFLPTSDGLEAVLKGHQDESFILETGILGVVTSHTEENKRFYHISDGCAYMVKDKLFLNVLYCSTDEQLPYIQSEYQTAESSYINELSNKMKQGVSFSLDEIVVY